jgi:hypothetical protein
MEEHAGVENVAARTNAMETPSTKLQKSSKSQTSNTKDVLWVFGDCFLELFWSLVLGAW